MELFGSWGLPLLAVGLLAVCTVVFALWVGRWIDAQSNSVIDKPREERKRKPRKNE
ncbi:MAG: hypothetical protein M3014_10610 [Chloroflexota bacterium]|nr:hypothetical protein [Chloroflexota bacterium]